MAIVYSALVGLKDLYYAVLTKDDDSGIAYGVPAKIAPAVNAKITPSVNSEILYADDGAAETTTALGEISVEIETSDLPLEIQAILLGHTLDVATGVMTKKASDTAPYVALGFKSKKSNGKYRFVWLLKGKFSPVDEEYKTSEDKISYNTPKMKASFIKRSNDDVWQYIADEDSGFTGTTTWFDNVYSPVIDTTPPTVTTNIADAAVGVAVNTNFVWTFSEAIKEECVNGANFFVITSAGVAVAGALSISTDLTTVTFNPTVDLSGATSYVAVATTNIKDLSNNALAVNNVVNFTTV